MRDSVENSKGLLRELGEIVQVHDSVYCMCKIEQLHQELTVTKCDISLYFYTTTHCIIYF